MPHDRVVTTRGGVHAAVVEIERQTDFGVLGQELIKSRAEMHAAERYGSGDTQRAASLPRRSARSAVASSISRMIRKALW